MTVFVDTSAFLALGNRADRAHAAAVKAFADLEAADTTLLTTNYVLVETIALLQHRFGVEAVQQFGTRFLPLLDVTWLGATEHASALEALLAAGKREISLVDYASFLTMRRHDVTTAFAFDLHFADQGFTLLPNP